MFNNLKKKFTSIIKKISGQGRITEKNIKNTLREIRKTLLEADVSLFVIQELIKNIKKTAIGKNVNNSLTPGQEFIKIIKNELILIMGNKNNNINFSKKKPFIFLIIGLQGSGKTSSIGKLGKFINKKYKKKILVSSIDIYRPAAMHQLKIIAKQAKIDFFKPKNTVNIIEMSKIIIQEAHIKLYDIVILDTPGQININNNIIQEMKNINNIIKPNEILFVLDSMMGQNAINVAKNFNIMLPISGVILTKLDSDTRSGSALSVNYILKKPIKFISTGEKINNFQIFHPERIVSRILGMGDIFSIIEKIDNKIDHHNIEKINNKINKKKSFDLNDFKLHIMQIDKLGGINNLIKKLPNNLSITNTLEKNNNKNILIKMKAIIDSMTPHERKKPFIIKGSRKKRIAKGSGTHIQDINILLKKFNELKNIMKNFQKGGIKKIFQNFKNIIPNIF